MSTVHGVYTPMCAREALLDPRRKQVLHGAASQHILEVQDVLVPFLFLVAGGLCYPHVLAQQAVADSVKFDHSLLVVARQWGRRAGEATWCGRGGGLGRCRVGIVRGRRVEVHSISLTWRL
jgi:hypothetical protein